MGLVGRRPSLDISEKKQSLAPAGIQTLDRSTPSLVAIPTTPTQLTADKSKFNNYTSHFKLKIA
jgi:hypothetical protein